MATSFTNEKVLDRVHKTASIDEAKPDSAKLLVVQSKLTQAGESLKTLAAEVGWTGLSAESSAEAFSAMGSCLLGHADNVGTLSSIAVSAEEVVASGRTAADSVGAAPFSSFPTFTSPSAPAEADPNFITDYQAMKILQDINTKAAELLASATSVHTYATENPVPVSGADPSQTPVPGPGRRGGYGGPNLDGGASLPVGPGSSGSQVGVGYLGGPSGGSSTGTVGTGWTPAAGGGHGAVTEGAHGSVPGAGSGSTGGRGASTSVDGSTGGYVNGGGAYGSGDRGGVSGFTGSTGAGGAYGSGAGGGGFGSSGASAGVIGAGTAGLLGGARSGALGGGVGGGLFGGGGAGARPGGPGLAGASGGRGSGAGGGFPGASGASGAAGTGAGTHGMVGAGGGAGGAGGSSKKGKRTSATYLAPTIDDEPGALGRVAAMGAGSRSGLAASARPELVVDDPDDDRC